MYHSRFFFSRLAGALKPVLEGARLLEAYSQQKDELILQFERTGGDDFFIKADLSQGVCILSFPDHPGRSRANTVNLFPELLSDSITEVIPDAGDRKFQLRFSRGLLLCFKMYGQRSNLILHDGNRVVSVFNHHLRKDLLALPAEPARIPEEMQWTVDPEELRKRCPAFTPRIWKYWNETAGNCPAAELPERFRQMVLKLEEGKEIYLCREGNEAFLSFFPMGHVLEEFSDPLSASNRYYQKFWQVNQFHARQESALRRLQVRASDLHNQIGILQANPVSGRRNYRLMADLLMAYGHAVSPGLDKAVLPDFEGSGTVEIPLKKDLSIAGNAERYYRKARGQQEDEQRYLQSLEALRKKYAEMLRLIQEITETADLRALRKLLPDSDEKAAVAADPALPFHVIRFMNFEIRVGKNARSNDELLRMSHKDDLWLHARDVPGSHVIIRTKKGISVPLPVRERAASLAAAYSKAGKESLVPVMITERKYVRKIKGAAPGLVKVDRSKTLLSAPQEL